MFRAAAPGPYDEAIAKATDENLTSEDWGAIMEVCDRVSSDANGSREAVQSLIKRLAHRNANVQLYTLEVANALSQNCGQAMHRELSSRAFTDALLKLANDRNTHAQVKAKIVERMKGWSDMFRADPDLGVMADAYHRLRQSNPSLQHHHGGPPPSAPQKNSLTELDRQKEEEELQLALTLSLQEEERKKKAAQPGPSGSGGGASGSGAGAGTGATGAAGEGAVEAPVPMPSGTTAATVSRVRALYDFVPSEPGELEFKKGDVIAVLESVYKDWWRGSLKGQTGIFPLNYVEKLADPTPEELQREAQMEAEVFAEIKNVEKLLTLLSTSNTAPREEDNEEISKLYHQTLAIRPKLIKLIEKYSQKKDDFTQLNEKFIKARRDYEALLESSMAHPPQPTYHQYAMRPQIPQGYPTPAPGNYAQPQAPPQQDPQRFYTPAPAQEQPQYPPSSPPPNFQRPVPGAAPAPFYMAGAEVPAQGGPPPPQQQQQQPPQQQQHQQQQQQQQPQQQQQAPSQPPSQPPVHPTQSYPQRDQVPSGPRLPLTGKQPAPIQTSPTPPAPSNQQQPHYGQYPPSTAAAAAAAAGASSPPPVPGSLARPQSLYGGVPQELSTSVYDSPIAPHPSSAVTYSSSVYSPDEPYAPAFGEPNPYAVNITTAPFSAVPAPLVPAPLAPSAPPPSVPQESQARPLYQPYRPYAPAPVQQYAGYEGSGDR